MARRPTAASLGLPPDSGLGIAMPPALRPVAAAPEPGPGVVVAFTLDGRAVPWKAPNVTRNGTFSPPEMRAWQSTVRHAAGKAMGARRPYPGAVVLFLDFLRARVKARPTEVLWVGRPDLTNLQKNLEDGLKGVVFVDDAQVVEARVTKRRGDRDAVVVRVEKARGEG